MRKPFIVFIFSIAFLTCTAYGFPLLNSTQSDKDIALLEHLIEVDAVQFQSENTLYVRETLIFKNVGTQNFSGSLRTWVPDGAEIVKRNDREEITKEEMTSGNITDYLPISQNGNIVSWRDDIEINSVASFYIIEYLVKAKPEGVRYTKMLSYPALINYQYVPNKDIPPLVLVITKPQDSSITLTDENGNKIIPSDVSGQGSTVTDRFSSVEFKGFNIGFSGATNSAQIAVYVIIGLIVVLALLYSFLRRSGKFKAHKEKIRGSLKKEEKDTEFERNTRDELVNLKNEMLSKVSELDKEYKSGDLLDEEYEELRKPYKEKIERITRRIEKL